MESCHPRGAKIRNFTARNGFARRTTSDFVFIEDIALQEGCRGAVPVVTLPETRAGRVDPVKELVGKLTVETAGLDRFQSYIVETFSRKGVPVNRCSQILFSQLARMPNYGGVNYPLQFVEREIMHLEGLGQTRTKPAAPLRGQLRGFMHKHFFVPGYEHLGVNARLAWKLDNNNSRKFSQMASSIAKRYKDEQTTDGLWKFSGEIAAAFTKGLTDRLSGTGTGDWIIYITHETRNYYLCIAKHGENDFILNTITLCAAEFPFINDILTDMACAGSLPPSTAGAT